MPRLCLGCAAAPLACQASGCNQPLLARPTSFVAETLPAAVRRWRQLGMPLLLELLAGVRASIEGAAGAGGAAAGGSRGGRTLAQQLFAQAQAFLQVANILNEEYPEVRLGCMEGCRCCGPHDTQLACLSWCALIAPLFQLVSR